MVELAVKTLPLQEWKELDKWVINTPTGATPPSLLDQIFSILRVSVAGIILGIIVGKIVVDKPKYLDFFRVKQWGSKIKKVTPRNWAKFGATVAIFTAMSYYAALLISQFMVSQGISAVDPTDYPFYHLPPLLLAFIVTIMPIFEEWIFRGIVLEEVSEKSKSKIVGLVVSALLFAVFHLSNPGMLPASMLPLTVSGFLLGGAYLIGGLPVAISSHCLYNAIIALSLL